MTLRNIVIAGAACLLSFAVQSAAWATYSTEAQDSDGQATSGWYDAGWTAESESESATGTFTYASLSTFSARGFSGGSYWHAHWCRRYPNFCQRIRGQEPPAVPEPGAMALLLVGGLIAVGCAHQRRRTVVRA